MAMCALVQLLAVVGESLDCGDSVCGVTLSLRYNDDTLSLWNRSSEDAAVRDRHR